MNASTRAVRGLCRSMFAMSVFVVPLLCLHGRMNAQISPNSYPSSSQTIPVPNNDPFGHDRGAMDEKLQHSRERAREADRQRRMVDDANRLLALAVQYRTQVQKHGSATPEDERLLAEMEKLARSVKDRMRGM